MTEEQKAVAIKSADLADEIARRLRLPDPEPALIEAAADTLESLAQNLRAQANSSEA